MDSFDFSAIAHMFEVTICASGFFACMAAGLIVSALDASIAWQTAAFSGSAVCLCVAGFRHWKWKQRWDVTEYD